MRERLTAELDKDRTIGDLTIGTFHSICLSLLRETGKAVTLLSQEDAQAVAAGVLRQAGAKLPPAKLVQAVSRQKNGLPVPENVNAAFCESYVARCRELDVLDFDDLLLETLALFEAGELPEEITQRFTYLLVDEFQDIDALHTVLCGHGQKAAKVFLPSETRTSLFMAFAARMQHASTAWQKISPGCVSFALPKIIAPRRRCLAARCL